MMILPCYFEGNLSFYCEQSWAHWVKLGMAHIPQLYHSLYHKSLNGQRSTYDCIEYD